MPDRRSTELSAPSKRRTTRDSAESQQATGPRSGMGVLFFLWSAKLSTRQDR